MNTTLEYYNKNAERFAKDTQKLEFTEVQDKFLGYLTPGGRILDFGCGAGRDTKYFLTKGFLTEATDGSEEMVKIASEYTRIQVRKQQFQELEEENKYDGIWACSSILHLHYCELKTVMGKLARALTSKGILYTSFKYGVREGQRGGRFFTDMTEEKIEKLLEEVPLFIIEEMWKTNDVRPGREGEKWLNLILKKME